MYKNKKLSRIAGPETKTWRKEYRKIKRRRSRLTITTIIAVPAFIKMEVILCQHAAAALRPGELQQAEPRKERGRERETSQPLWSTSMKACFFFSLSVNVSMK